MKHRIKKRTAFKMTVAKQALCLSFVSLALSSCGGGSEPPSIDHDEAPEVEKVVVHAPTAFPTVNVSEAHDAGIKGAGITVAIVDTGLNQSLDAFEGRIDANSTNILDGSANLSDTNGHGTAVASLISSTHQSIAPEASLMVIKSDYRSGRFSPTDLAKAVDHAQAQDADIINLSIAGGIYTPSALKDAIQKSVDKGILLVVAAGNRGLDSPQYPARDSSNISGTGQMIAVGAVDETGAIASFSNRAGDSQDYFLVAPGSNIPTVSLSGDIENHSGTSFAAPLVAGAAALVKQKAPHLNGAQIAEILLTTAKDLGAPGVDSIYGHGLLDIANALKPLGVSVVPKGESVSEDLSDYEALEQTQIVFDPSFAEAVLNAFEVRHALGNAISLDQMGRAYQVDLQPAMSPNVQEDEIGAWIRASDDDLNFVEPTDTSHMSLGESLGIGGLSFRFGEQIHKSAVSRNDESNPYLLDSDNLGKLRLGLDKNHLLNMHRNWQTHAFLNLGSASTGQVFTELDSVATGLHVSWQPNRNSSLSSKPMLDVLNVTAAQLHQKNRILNSVGTGAFAVSGHSKTQTLDLQAGIQLNERVKLHGSYAWGTTSLMPTQQAGLIQRIDKLRAESFSVGMQLQNPGLVAKGSRWKDQLSFLISQPLRAKSGTMAISVPTARDVDGTLSYQNVIVGLKPPGRQIDFSLEYKLANSSATKGRQQAWAAKLLHTRDPNHNRNAKSQTGIGIKYKLKF